MTVRAIGEKVIIEPEDAEETSAGGVIIPEAAQERPQRGIVIHSNSSQLHKGNEVIFSRFSGTEIEDNGIKLLVLHENEILAVVS